MADVAEAEVEVGEEEEAAAEVASMTTSPGKILSHHR